MVQERVLERCGDRRPHQHEAHHQEAGKLPPPDPDGVRLEGGLLCGWNVGTRDPLARIPLLYGENGKPLYGINADAIYAPMTATGRYWRSRAAAPSSTTAS